MTTRIAINGYGRIGRNILRAHYEGGKKHDIAIVAINDLGDFETNVHLTRFDSAHGKFPLKIETDKNYMIIDEDKILTLNERDPSKLPWDNLAIDIVLECTGLFTSREKAEIHLKRGARRVLISAPGIGDMDATIVFGVNHGILSPKHRIISNASCTTNCLASLVNPLHDALGLDFGFMTTIHSYTNDQVLTDVFHKDLRRARSATMSMIPTKTGAASAVGLVIPELKGKLDGYAVRVPTINVSMLDLSFISKRTSSEEEVNEILKYVSQNELKGILKYSEEPLVSIDYNHDPASSIVDASLTKVLGRLVKISSWYDNEWGFSNRMLDTASEITKAEAK